MINSPKLLNPPVPFVLDYQIITEFATFDLSLAPTIFSFEYGFGLNANQNLVSNQAGIILRADNELPLAKLVVNTGFKFEEKYWNEITQTGKVILPKNLAAHLLTINVGSLRGAILAKFENTTLANFRLPLFNISSLFDDDVVLEITSI